MEYKVPRVGIQSVFTVMPSVYMNVKRSVNITQADEIIFLMKAKVFKRSPPKY